MRGNSLKIPPQTPPNLFGKRKDNVGEDIILPQKPSHGEKELTDEEITIYINKFIKNKSINEQNGGSEPPPYDKSLRYTCRGDSRIALF
ncbi:MAG: hypothetical protein IJ499_05035 [Clostridia bacterium]|nr:hypothetical protein [Clostridia bacterium]